MSQDTRTQREARIERFLERRTNKERWKVGEAKAKLSELINRAEEGELQLVGVRKPVIMMGMDELKTMLNDIQEPESWAEFFPITPRPEGVDELELAEPRSLERAEFELDDNYPGSEAMVEDEAQLLAAEYEELGDLHGAYGVLRDEKEGVDHRVKLVELGKLEFEVKGPGIEGVQRLIRDQRGKRDHVCLGKIVKAEGRHVYVSDGMMAGVGYVNPRAGKDLKAGDAVRYRIVEVKGVPHFSIDETGFEMDEGFSGLGMAAKES